MLAAGPAANETSAARRRQRRLRQFLRHERLTFAMLLAERDHHTAPQGTEAGQERGSGARGELRAKATGSSTPTRGSHGRLRGCPGAPPRTAGSGWWRHPGRRGCAVPPAQSLLQRQREEEEAAQRLVKEAEEAKEKEERKAKFEEKMLVVNRRVRDGIAT